MNTIKYALLVRGKQCCCNSDSPEPTVQEEVHQESTQFLTNASNIMKVTTASKEILEEKASPVLGLTLEVEISDTLEPKRLYHVTPFGLRESSKPNTRKTIIGADPETCDIPLPNEAVESMQCEIEYLYESGVYLLTDLGGEYHNTYLKIEDRYALKEGDVLAFGESVAAFNIQENDIQPVLVMKLYQGPMKGETMTFKPDEEVKIGQAEDCLQQFKSDLSMSRHHCAFSYDPASGWIVTDGDRIRRSANGTW